MYETTTDATLDELRSSALLLEVIADNVGDLIGVVGCTGRRIWNNFAYARRLGYEPDELKGATRWWRFTPRMWLSCARLS